MNKPNASGAAAGAKSPADVAAADLPQTDEERRIVELVKAGLDSGPAVPMDNAFFERLRKRTPTER